MLAKGEYERARDDGDRGSAESAAADVTDGSFDEPTEHEIYEILSNQRRRYALRALSGTPSGVSLGTLADQVAAWENDTTVEDVSTDQRKRVYTALQQSHLPKMERTGMVRFDQDAARVLPTEHLDCAELYLDVRGGTDLPWNRIYLGLSLVAGVVVAGVANGVVPFAALPTLAWFALVVGVFGASAVVHTYQTRTAGPTETPPDRKS
jgi:hypothetical protein